MKRALFAVGTLLGLILLGASTMAAEESASLTIRPSTMADGETKTLIDDGKTITVHRQGDALKIQIEGADETRRLVIMKGDDGEITIDRDGDRRSLRILTPGARLLDGMPHLKRFRDRSGNFFHCPKDGTMLRVPEGKESETYRCPVDGTNMEKKKGAGFMLWLGDGLLEGESL